MNSDPWLTKDGKLHPAAEWGGMPEWKGEEGINLRLTRDRWGWLVEWESESNKRKADRRWVPHHYIAPHEAAALLEKHLREKLVAKYAVDGGTLIIDCEGVDGYCYITVRTGDGAIRALGEGDTYTAALQAAALAAKGENDE